MEDTSYKITEPLRTKVSESVRTNTSNTTIFDVFVGFINIPGNYEKGLIERAGGYDIGLYHRIPSAAITISADGINLLSTFPEVTHIEEIGIANILSIPGKGYVDYNILAQQITWGATKVRAPDVWAKGIKGKGVKVMVLDTGIDYTHEDLKQNYKGGHNFITGTDDPMDRQGHGTWCCGCIGAADNNVGIVGIAPECDLYAVKVLDDSQNGSGSYDNIVAGLHWAIDNKMDVVSMSFGGSPGNITLQQGIQAAAQAGIVLVAAAGNAGGSGCNMNNCGYPAMYDECIAVAATDSNDGLGSFSSRCSKVEVAAPGVNTISTVPTGTCPHCDPSGYASLSGTSMATPHVAGVAALIKSANKSYTSSQIRQCLTTTAIHLGDAGRNGCFGYGRVDALGAISCTPATPPPTITPPPTVTPPPTTVPPGGEFRYSCKEIAGFKYCGYDPSGEYPDLTSCLSGCMGISPPPTVPPTTIPPTTIPPTTIPPTTIPPTTLPPGGCGKDSYTIGGKCINKIHVYEGLGLTGGALLAYILYKKTQVKE